MLMSLGDNLHEIKTLFSGESKKKHTYQSSAECSQSILIVTHLTLLLLNMTCLVLANSVDPDQLKKPTDLDLHYLSLNM